MGRILQKRKNRSSLNKIRQRPKKKVAPPSDPFIAARWSVSLHASLLHAVRTFSESSSNSIYRNRRETLIQNYRRLGLTPRLRGHTGGVERKARVDSEMGASAAVNNGRDSLTIVSEQRVAAATANEVAVERDSTGAIVRVIRPESSDLLRKRRNPLNDPLNDLSDVELLDEDEPLPQDYPSSRKGRDIYEDSRSIRELTELARMEAAPPRPVRRMNTTEKAWIEELVKVHGNDYSKIFWDRKLNPMQRTENDIRRRVERWKRENGIID